MMDVYDNLFTYSRHFHFIIQSVNKLGQKVGAYFQIRDGLEISMDEGSLCLELHFTVFGQEEVTIVFNSGQDLSSS